MINFINGKLNGKPYIKDEKEQGEYYTLLSNSMLSQGSLSGPLRLKIPGYGVVLLGRNIQHFAIRLMDWRSETVRLGKHIIKTVDLWKLLLEKLYEIFPASQAEALNNSKELARKDISTPGFDYTKEGDKPE